MRLQTEQHEVTLHRALGQTGGRSSTAHAPVAGTSRPVIENRMNQLGHTFVSDTTWSPRTQPCQSLLAWQKRRRHKLTVGRLTPQRRATSVQPTPSADSSTIFARRTRPCGSDRERTSDSSCARSGAETSTFRFGRPVSIVSLS